MTEQRPYVIAHASVSRVEFMDWLESIPCGVLDVVKLTGPDVVVVRNVVSVLQGVLESVEGATSPRSGCAEAPGRQMAPASDSADASAGSAGGSPAEPSIEETTP